MINIEPTDQNEHFRQIFGVGLKWEFEEMWIKILILNI